MTSLAVTKALENMANAAMRFEIGKDQIDDIEVRRQCFGREVCLRMIEDRRLKSGHHVGVQNTIFQNLVRNFETMFLLYIQLNDYSLEFQEFLKKIKYDEVSNNPIGCFEMFPECF